VKFDSEHLATDLRRLGVAAGDVLMVHASLRAIGSVDGGADGVIDGLETALGPSGTLLMTLGARDGAEQFDCLVTPADPDVGVLAEVFRKRPATLVSDHPEGRFGASGPFAEKLVENVPWDDYYGPGSPLERFVHAEGRVLRLGADLDTLTVLHYAEYLAPLPAKRRVRRHCVVVGPQGPEPRVVECLDDSDGIVEYPGEDYFAVILREYLSAGRAKTGVVGRATSELIEASDVVYFAVGWMVEHFH
jgi:aminoglycoside 3-N-acetyltransferase